MSNVLNVVSEYKDVIEISFTLAMICLTCVSSVIALTAVRKQVTMLRFMEWTTLKTAE